MRPRTRAAFLALVMTQGAHSLEEFFFGLYEVFSPAASASRLVSDNAALGFAILNSLFFAFGVWCYVCRVRPDRPSALYWMWPWVLVSLGNGVVHPTMAAVRGGYFPGVATAPFLFVLAVFIARDLMRASRSSP